jgi:hypothetical protein
MLACVALIRLWTTQQVLMEGLTKVITTLSQSVAEKGQEVENQAQQIADLRTSVQVRGFSFSFLFLSLSP